MSVANYAPRQPRSANAPKGEPWSDEKRKQFEDCWLEFKRAMAPLQPKMSRDFKATLLEVSTPFVDQEDGKTKRTIKVELRTPGMEMCRFQRAVADNPFFINALLHKLVVALTGKVPQEEAGLSINFSDYYGAPIVVAIKKGNKRETGDARKDEQRGGFYADLADISTDWDAPALVAAPANPTPPATPASPSPTPETDEETPWS